MRVRGWLWAEAAGDVDVEQGRVGFTLYTAAKFKAVSESPSDAAPSPK